MFKKKKESFLYAGLKEKAISEKEIKVDPDEITIPIKEKQVHIKRKLVVSITSLKHGVGCSYMSVATSNYLSNIRHKEKTCILHHGCTYIDQILEPKVDSIFLPCNMGEIYASYGYIIHDGGLFKESDKSLIDRSDIKIMMCWYNSEYSRLLTEFIPTRNDLNSWVFIFNHVPKNMQKGVYALMEDYNVFCLPIMDVTHLGKAEKRIFQGIFSL